MKDMQTEAFIDESTAKDVLIGVGGALSMFSISRFFKGHDSVKERLRVLENGHTAIIKDHKYIQDKLKETLSTLKVLEEYTHTVKHDLASMINEKTLKDGIVDDVYDKVQNIENLLKEKR
jgi:phosphoribosylamine-glycine ligase